MIGKTFEEAFTPEWIETNVQDGANELVVIRRIIPWDAIIGKLVKFYDDKAGANGISLRIMAAILILSRFRKLSDREIVKQIKENRYMQFFCNVPDIGLQTFLHPATLCLFRKRIGEEGCAAIEDQVFEMLRLSGVIVGNDALMDSTVLPSDIVYPNDVQLVFKAFKKMRSLAKLHGLPLWWNDQKVKELWRQFNLDKKGNRIEWLASFNEIFVPALETFKERVESLNASPRQKAKAEKTLALLELLEEQTLQKLAGEKRIKNRIVSLDDPDARPIKKGKKNPDCEFGSTLQTTFNRDGFMITVENFIGSPNDSTLYPNTLDLYIKRMSGHPGFVVTDLGYRSRANLNEKTPGKVEVFMGRSGDVSEENRDHCRKARSATEGFIAVAKNLRGFGKSFWHMTKGHAMWSLLCQAACNLKKFLQLLGKDKIGEESLVKLGLA